MVCNLTLSHGESSAIEELRITFSVLRGELLRLAEADERVFSAYRDATALPRSDAEQKASRRAAIEDALVAAAGVPLQMSADGIDVLEALRLTTRVGTAHAVGDLLTGGYLVQVMVLGSIENIRANARLMRSSENRDRFESATSSVREDLGANLSMLEAAVSSRAK